MIPFEKYKLKKIEKSNDTETENKNEDSLVFIEGKKSEFCEDKDENEPASDSVPLNVINDPNHVFKVAETFVGCGGSHFGFKKSGFQSVFVNDIWEDAINTLKQNDSSLKPNEVICDDIYNINSETLSKKNIDISNIDVFIGGVVCKGFSLAGVRNPYDERNYLYLQQLRLVGILKPKISIIENVPGLNEIDNGKGLTKALEALSKIKLKKKIKCN
jgi:site-specific DNA-cytosine methylase